MRLLLVLLVAAPVAAAPLIREKAPPPITPKNMDSVHEIGAIERDAWKLEFAAGGLALIPWEGDIEVLDPKTFKTVRKLAAGKKLVKFAFSRDGGRLAWAENNSTATIEDLKTGKTISFDTGQAQPSIAFSPDGKWVATGGYGEAATLWDAATGKKILDYETQGNGGLTPLFSPDGKVFALGNRNSDPRLFDAATGKLLHVLPRKMTQEIRFNPAGTLLATTYVDGGLGLWDVATGKLVHEAKSSASELYTVDWSPRGDLLVTAGLAGKITLWDPIGLKPLKEFDAPEWVIRARFSPDGSRVFTAGGNQQRDATRKITVWGLGDER
jgi:WD40 repeat protein